MSHFTLPPALVDDLAWTLIHFLWQGAALAVLLYLALPFCRSATSRHDMAVGALLLMAFAPVATFLILHTCAPGGAALVAAPDALLASKFTAGGQAVPSFQPQLLVWLVALWFAGVAGLSLRALGGWYLTQTWRHVDTLALPAELRQRCRKLQQQLALTRPVQFLQSRRVTTPMVIGWFKPVVLIPVSAITGLPVEQLDALILHELAHIVRRDAFTNALQVVVETILFYHPAVWWVSRRIRIEREHCCDDAAVSACGDVSTYVEALISLESTRAVPRIALAAGGNMKDRVMRLLNCPAQARKASASALAGLVLLGLVSASVATAETAMPAGHQTLSIRVVDDTKSPNLVAPGDDRVMLAHPGAGEPKYLLLKRGGQISGDVVKEAHVAQAPNGRPTVNLTLRPGAAAAFQAMTRDNVGRRLAVVVGNRVVTAPKVREPMLGSGVQIDANFATKAEAQALIAAMMGPRP